MDLLERITASKDNTESICERLAENGVAFVPNFIEQDDIDSIREEFLQILALEIEGETLRKGKDTLQRISDLSMLDKYPKTQGLSKSPMFEQVQNDFYWPYRNSCNALYAARTKEPNPLSHEWHMDMGAPSIKFFIYLNDVTEKNGAFRYALGSHREAFYRRMYVDHRYTLTTKETIPLFYIANPEQTLRDVLPIEGPAGSLIVFNTLGYHRAGYIEEGGTRDIMRFHTCTVDQENVNASDPILNEHFNIPKHVGFPSYLVPQSSRQSTPVIAQLREVADNKRFRRKPTLQSGAESPFIPNVFPQLKEGDRIAIFGAGTCGSALLKMLGEVDPQIDVIGFGDNDTQKQGNTHEGKPVLTPETLVAMMPDWIAIANLQWYPDIAIQLSSLGYPIEKMVQFEI